MAKYSKAAQKNVESAMKKMEKGTLRSGKSNKKVTNPKQAIAIGLSEAREKGAKVPKKKTAVKKSATKKAASKKTTVKKAAAVKKPTLVKKAALKKKVTASKKAGSKKTIPKKNNKTDQKTISPVDVFENVNLDTPPVEERSQEIKSVLPERLPDPILSTDKKALAKAVTKHDLKHNIQLSGPKNSIRPSGKKPLWR